MAGTIKIGGVALASYSDSTANISLDNNVVFPAGHVIQVKQFVFSKIASTSSATLTEITDGTIKFQDSITVKANSKILVKVDMHIGITGNQGHFVDLQRSTDDSSYSQVTQLQCTSSSPANQGGFNGALSLIYHAGLTLKKETIDYLDETITSAGTYYYKLFYKRGSTGTVGVNYPPNIGSSTNPDYGAGVSTMTLMEIAG
tara:strand:+ start:37 stop:639 length:603 start_codon:yes stop_codon:yes gene_type:complete